MRDLLIILFMLVGGGFTLVAALGIVRMPDLYSRMHCATKVGTLGVSTLIVAVAIHFGEVSVGTRALLIIAFFLLTAPVAAHMIGRAAHHAGVPLWGGTVRDEWPKDPPEESGS